MKSPFAIISASVNSQRLAQQVIDDLEREGYRIGRIPILGQLLRDQAELPNRDELYALAKDFKGAMVNLGKL